MPVDEQVEAGFEMVGPDKVCLEGERLVIYAKRDMDDWVVREFKRPEVRYCAQRYYIRTKGPANPPFALRYELWPWPADRHECPSYIINYDLAYVEEREALHVADARAGAVNSLLLVFYPFLGFFWSGFKARWIRYGLNPRSITSASVFAGFCATMVLGVFVGWLGMASTTSVVTLLLLTVDTIARFSKLLSSDEAAPGFLEWVFLPSRGREPDA